MTEIISAEGFRWFLRDNSLDYIVQGGHEYKLLPYFEGFKGTFIDVGAHTGRYTVRMAARHDVIAWEPDPYARTVLEINLALNGLEQEATIWPFAAWSKEEMLRLQHRPDGIGELGETGFEVEARPLDDCFDSTSHVGFIKIDVEGAEVEVLEGASRLLMADRPQLLIEVHDRTHNLPDLPKRLGSLLTDARYQWREVPEYESAPSHYWWCDPL